MSAAVAAAVLAVLVFVLTQSSFLVLEPVREQKRLIGEVANALLFPRLPEPILFI